MKNIVLTFIFLLYCIFSYGQLKSTEFESKSIRTMFKSSISIENNYDNEIDTSNIKRVTFIDKKLIFWTADNSIYKSFNIMYITDVDIERYHIKCEGRVLLVVSVYQDRVVDAKFHTPHLMLDLL